MFKISKIFKKTIVKLWFSYGGLLMPRVVARSAYYFLFCKPIKRKPTLRDAELINQAKIVKLMINNKRIHGYIWGTGSKCVLLAHGWSSNSLTMRRFIPLFIQAGFQVIAFDAPAHGNSEGKRTNGREYRQVLNVLLNTYKPHAVIGHSFGGICSLFALSDIPEHIVKKVVIIAAPFCIKGTVNQFLIKTKLHRHSHKYFLAHVEKGLNANPHELNLAHAYPEGIKRQGIIVHDKADEVISFSEAIELNKIWLQATLIVTEGLGHSRVLKDANVVTYVVNYIVETYP